MAQRAGEPSDRMTAREDEQNEVGVAHGRKVLCGLAAPTSAIERTGVGDVGSERLPNFFVIGAAKAGTTSLYSYLGQHPQIFMPRLKELGFFQVDEEFERGLSVLLRQHYQGAQGFLARGEATPTYLYNEFVAERIAVTLPVSSHRFLVLFRDPVERAYSAYLHMVRLKVETETFERGLELEPVRIRDDIYRSYSHAYVQAGMYARFLEPWIERFGRPRVLPVFSEELRNDPAAVMREICEFLEVDPGFEFDASRRLNVASDTRFGLLPLLWRTPTPVKRVLNAAISHRVRGNIMQYIGEKDTKPMKPSPMNEATAARLRTVFAEDVRSLERITGRDLSAWAAVG